VIHLLKAEMDGAGGFFPAPGFFVGLADELFDEARFNHPPGEGKKLRCGVLLWWQAGALLNDETMPATVTRRGGWNPLPGTRPASKRAPGTATQRAQRLRTSHGEDNHRTPQPRCLLTSEPSAGCLT
jgi:hypothetical protein